MKPPIQIGSHTLKGRVFLAPMAGITDAPFRALCADFGAALTFSEMITSDVQLWQTEKTKTRLVWADNEPIRAIQLAGSDPEALVQAAKAAVDAGATWIDINMGCPMKKVCRVWAGSALMSQPTRVAEILTALVKNISVPITLKTRTGSDLENKNAVEIAHIAEDCGVQMITIHGRTRAQRFEGNAEYQTIAAVKARISIPVIANGDIKNSAQALEVLQQTGADGVMIGRAAFGQPWLFNSIDCALNSTEDCQHSKQIQCVSLINDHIEKIHQLYGEYRGLRIARKHLGWYAAALGLPANRVSQLLRIEDAKTQIRELNILFHSIDY